MRPGELTARRHPLTGQPAGATFSPASPGRCVNHSDPFGLSPQDCRIVKCPDIKVIENSPAVRKAGEAMLRASMKDNSERGAFLFNGPDGTVRVGDWKTGKPGAGEVKLGDAPPDAIGTIHTHQPIPGVNGMTFPGGPPSADDAALVRGRNSHGVVEEPGLRHFQPVDRQGDYYTVKRVPPVTP